MTPCKCCAQCTQKIKTKNKEFSNSFARMKKLARSLWSKRPTATLGWAIRNVSPIFLFAETSSTLTTSSAALHVHETKDRRDASTAIGNFVGKQSVITFLFSFYLSMDNQLFFNRRFNIFGQQNLFQFG